MSQPFPYYASLLLENPHCTEHNDQPGELEFTINFRVIGWPETMFGAELEFGPIQYDHPVTGKPVTLVGGELTPMDLSKLEEAARIKGSEIWERRNASR